MRAVSQARTSDLSSSPLTGPPQAKVSQAIDTPRFAGWVKNATDAASKNKVDGTPTVLVDGTVVDWTSIPQLVDKIDQAVKAD